MGAALPIRTILGELGCDLGTVAADTGFDMHLFDDPDSRAPLAAMGKLLDGCATAARCPHFGVLVGQRVTTIELGLAGFVAKYARDVGTALRSLVANAPYLVSGASLVLTVAGPMATFEFTLAHGRFVGAGLIEDAAVTAMVSIIRQLSTPDWMPIEALFIHPEPAVRTGHARFFRAPVRFGTERNAIIFDRRWLDHAIGHADPELRTLLLREFRDELRSRPSFVEQVRHAMRPLIDARRCSVDAVAGTLGTRVWTMNRRLAEEGTSFRQLHDELRFELARRLLADTSLPLGDIAERLAFEQPAAFTRAFRRWSDRSPSEWRRGTGAVRASAGR